MIEHKTLDELNSIDPYEIPKIGYKCTVTITNIHEMPRWWYVGCAKCGKAPEVETVPFLCRCGWKDSTPLYKLSFQAKDDTGEARFFGYDEVSRRIIRRNIDFMLRQSRQAAGLPQHFKDLISRKYTFVVGVTNSSFQDPRFRTYLVKTVSIDYHEKAFIANQNLLVQTPSQTTASTSSGSLALQITDPNALNNQVETVTQITTLTNASTPPPAIVTDDTPTKDATNQAQHIRSLQPRTLFPPAACAEKTDMVSEQIETANALSAHTIPELQAPGTQDGSGSFPPSAKNKKNSVEQKDSHIEKGSHIDDSTKDEHVATTAIAPQHGIKRSTPADSGCKTRDDICKATPSKSHK
ncbi:hypothetical protein BDA96_03G361600 [Sorghum bicolor]|uniref:Replication factor A C-terminal domain-containing protein n=1 Tax=Sorghum bicolor TaxID=4558 RepID=A0A921RIU4_SORBI|nr:hypothetical protein BDA96_03G361600 [Sorghum bicolor]